MPRKSAAAHAMTPFAHVKSTRLACPGNLHPAAAEIWRRLVSSCAPNHFVPADVELLRAYCENACLAQESFREMQRNGRIIDNKLSVWALLLEKSTRALASLAPRLRLGPSARTDPKTVARAALKNGPSPSIYNQLGWNDDAA